MSEMELLLKNRTFRLSNEIVIDAKDYIIENFLISLSDYDIVIGSRADDSYFSFLNVQNERAANISNVVRRRVGCCPACKFCHMDIQLPITAPLFSHFAQK